MAGSARSGTRRRVGSALASLALAAAVLATTTAAAGPVVIHPYLGILAAPPTMSSAQLHADGVQRLSVNLGWDRYEPAGPGSVDEGYVDGLRDQLASYRSDGFDVVLDLGLQYPPAWVFDLPGQTRFVDQDGAVWHGRSSEDVPNAVFDPAVRAAQADYVRRVAADLGAQSFAAVRLGGLLSGELRYPPAAPGSATGQSLWAYDPAAQAAAPDPGWRPGTGTTTQATAFLDFYLDALTAYESFQLDVVGDAFPPAELQVMLPSFGLRPAMEASAVAGRLSGATPAEHNGLVGAGLDWVAQVGAIAASGRRGTAYSTWADGPDQGSSVEQQSPIRYLAGLGAQRGVPVGGENTGGGGAAALTRLLASVDELHLTGVMWFSGPDLAQRRDGLDLDGIGAGLRAAGLLR